MVSQVAMEVMNDVQQLTASITALKDLIQSLKDNVYLCVR